MANDIGRAEDYFRRAKDKNGDEKLLARGLLHLVKHLGMAEGRDFKRATELLERAWKTSGAAGRRKTGEAMMLVARELKSKKRNRTTSMTEKHRAIMTDLEAKQAKVAEGITDGED
jgi:hypothetical protein